MTTRPVVFLVLGLAAGCMEQQRIGTDNEPIEPLPDPADSPRVLEDLQVLYTFDEGEGLVVKDTSGVEPAFDLHLDNLVQNHWVPGGGIELVGPSVITSLDVAEKVFAACVQANAVTLEAWVEPANVEQSGTMFVYGKQGQRNARLAMTTTRYAGAVRTSTPDPAIDGEMITTTETVQTPDNIASLAAQHVVFTRDATGTRLYVDGADTAPPTTTPTTPTEPEPIGDHTEWSPTYQLALGADTNTTSPWLGKIYLAAIYCRALSPAEVAKNFSAGH